MDKLKELWNSMLVLLETEVSAITYDIWIRTLQPIEIKEGVLVLMASSETGKEFASSRLRELIKKAMVDVNNSLVDIEVVLADSEMSRTSPVDSVISQVTETSVVSEPLLINPKYNFESYVVGKSNQIANAAARAVAELPGQRYNPLFLYGGVGLGKTHLMHAIGNYVRSNISNLKVMYVSSEKFVNELINSIRMGKNSNSDFRDKYRSVDVLMIDDIQFISRTKSTQEEVFHTFNALYERNKQIVISSDRPPKEIPELDERLRSRFEWGMICDIAPPDIETRIAILQKKAQMSSHNIKIEVITFMAQQVSQNIREMEGLLNKVIFLSLLYNCPPSIELVKEALTDYQVHNVDVITSDDILDTVSSYFNVSKADITGKKKTKEIVEPRQICIYLMTEILDMPLASIGSVLGGRDHTTIMYGRDKIEAALSTNTRLALVLQDIRDTINRRKKR